MQPVRARCKYKDEPMIFIRETKSQEENMKCHMALERSNKVRNCFKPNFSEKVHISTILVELKYRHEKRGLSQMKVSNKNQ